MLKLRFGAVEPFDNLILFFPLSILGTSLIYVIKSFLSINIKCPFQTIKKKIIERKKEMVEFFFFFFLKSITESEKIKGVREIICLKI